MKFRKLASTLLLTAIVFTLSCAVAFAEGQEVSTAPENGIPLVIVYINETQADIEAAAAADPDHAYGNIQEMNESENHSVRALGDVEIKVPEGYQGEYGSVAVPEGRASLKYIRGRGNSTWSKAKKPYKIAFNSKQNLFGMGENKEWALLANAMDDTLVRNRITSWIGDHSKLMYSPQMIPVDVVMIGLKKDENGNEQEVSRDYLGSYCLSESVEIGDGRVEIDELKKNDVNTEANPELISGGYLLAIYSPAQDKDKVPNSSWFTTPSGIRITNEGPEFESEDLTQGRSDQRTYIRNYVNELDQLIMGSDEITGEVHDQIAAKMDLESLADYWWIQEFSYNTDAFTTGSTYMYKPRNGKLCWGPLWDFDLAWSVRIDDEQGYVTGFGNTEMTWVDELREKDQAFAQLLKDRWNNSDNGIRKALLQVTKNSNDGILNRYTAEINRSFAANQQEWADEDDPETTVSLDTSKKKLRSWIAKRIAWVDSNLNSIGTVHHTVTYEAEDGTVVDTQSVRDNTILSLGPAGPEKPGYFFKGWKEKADGEDHNGYSVTGDVTFTPYYIPENDVVKPTHLFLRCYEDWTEYSPEDGDVPVYYYAGSLFVLPEDADVGNVTWASSDESILTFGSGGPTSGLATVKGIGDVDVTATLWNGLSKTLRLHVYDPDKMASVDPDSMSFDPAAYTIRTGETIQVLPNYSPQDTPLTLLACEYVSDNESVVQLADDSKGVITGMKPGKATITVTASDITGTVSLQASFRVTVTGEDKPQNLTSISKAKVVLSKNAYTYNGKVRKPSIRSIGGKKLKEGRDYTVKWSNTSPKKVGKYTLAITGKGSYKGTTKASFKINPKGTKLAKLKKGRKAITATWKKQRAKMSTSRITGYRVQIATNKKFTKNKKTYTVKGYKRNSKKIKGLKSGKRYYVRIGTYKKVAGKKYCSTWSKAKAVTTE